MNIDSFFHVTTAALAHLPDGAAIINTSSINGLRGKNTLMEYAATKCGCPSPSQLFERVDANLVEGLGGSFRVRLRSSQ